MAKDGFTEVQQKLEAIALELKNENDPDPQKNAPERNEPIARKKPSESAACRQKSVISRSSLNKVI
jgi:hypothetical protein